MDAFMKPFMELNNQAKLFEQIQKDSVHLADMDIDPDVFAVISEEEI
jgi:hypothetical protein